jgi:hypothetical protein
MADSGGDSPTEIDENLAFLYIVVQREMKTLQNLIEALKKLRLPSRYEDGIAMAPMRRLEKSGDGEFNWAARAVLDAIKPHTH